MITCITFLIHPHCYAASLGNPTSMPAERWQVYHERELRVATRWYEEIDRAGPGEAVVYHPCYGSAEEKELAAYGAQALGERFLTLGGREELYTPETLAALAPEIAAAFRVRGKYAWSVHDLRIAAFSYHYARDLAAMFAARGMRFDPGLVRWRAMGESFEGCATTWTTMVPHYLGSPGRVEIEYALGVPDTFFLLGCQYRGRIPLACDTALYLFIDPEGRAVAHFKRERVTLADPSYHARLSVDPQAVSVLNGRSEVLLEPGGELPDAVPAALARRGEGWLETMVATGRGRGEGGRGYYPREAPLFLRAEEDIGLEAAARAAAIAPEG